MSLLKLTLKYAALGPDFQCNPHKHAMTITRFHVRPSYFILSSCFCITIQFMLIMQYIFYCEYDQLNVVATRLYATINTNIANTFYSEINYNVTIVLLNVVG